MRFCTHSWYTTEVSATVSMEHGKPLYKFLVCQFNSPSTAHQDFLHILGGWGRYLPTKCFISPFMDVINT